MRDDFALLGEPRQPWLDPEALKSRFLNLARETHPDRFQTASPAEREAAAARDGQLNAAYNTLREPKARLMHLLELERGQRPAGIEEAPPAMMDLFFEVGKLCREAEQFQMARQAITSPILKVKSFERGLGLTSQLQELQRLLRQHLDRLESELKQLNPAWDAAAGLDPLERVRQLPLKELEDLARAWSFANRWFTIVQEKIVSLAL